MTYQVAIMVAVAALLGAVGIALLVRLASPRTTQAQTYAFRMIGIMLTSAGIVLGFSAYAMQSWSFAP